MKALVVWDIHYQFLKLINFIVFFTKIKHDMDKEEKTQMSLWNEDIKELIWTNLNSFKLMKLKGT